MLRLIQAPDGKYTLTDDGLVVDRFNTLEAAKTWCDRKASEAEGRIQELFSEAGELQGTVNECRQIARAN